MSFLTNLAHLLVPVQTRSSSEHADHQGQIDALWRRHLAARAYRSPGIDEAMGVPAIFGAVSLIANTIGSLSLEAFRRGELLEQARAPRLIQRPNPFSTARDFHRDTAYYLATRGEAWWWVAVRDPLDNSPMSLYPVPPWEVHVERNENDRSRPVIRWGTRVMPNADMRQITYLPGPDGRGRGPLQLCDAAVSVTVEAQQWAANFYSGSIPSIIGTTEQDMTEDEMKLMDQQWNEKPANMPRWLTNGLTMSQTPVDPERAQLTEARQYQVGDVSRMFNMPGPLIEHQMSGSSLTYRNDAGIWTDFARRCLSPNYLEPLEQEFSDLLTNSTVTRFNLRQLLRADPKTRMEVHKTAIEAGIYDAAYASREEGVEPGSVDFAPVPFSPPQAVPASLPSGRSLQPLHCPKCGRVAGEVGGPARIRCKRCGTMVESEHSPVLARSQRLEYTEDGHIARIIEEG